MIKKSLYDNFWHRTPFARILVALIAGMIMQYYLRINVIFSLFVLGAALLLLAVFAKLSLAQNIRFEYWRNILLQMFVFAAGMLLVWRSDPRQKPDWYGRSAFANIAVRLTEPPVPKTRSVKAEARVVAVADTSGNTASASGNLLIYLEPSPKSDSLRYGHQLLISSSLQEIQGSKNPGAFNYAEYAAMQGFYHQVFLKDKDYIVLAGKEINPVWKVIYNSREFVLSVLRQNVSDDAKIIGIAEALLIGYKEDLDKEIVQSYTNTGVVHIIAISGLHLGLIYISLVWLVEKLPYIRRSKWAKVLIILFCLWFFSLLTGAPPSVQRSAVMFTCIVIGKYFYRQASIFNSLASSGFILIWFNPFLLWDVGFQLSYLAVTGIILLQPRFSKWIYMPPRSLKKIRNWPYNFAKGVWSLITASLAAQLFTMPLSLYYFHQMPLTFLFTNIMAVPLSTVILYIELLLLMVSSLSPVAGFVGSVITYLIRFLNWFILLFDAIPYSTVDHIYSNLITTLLLFAALGFFVYAWFHKNYKAALFSIFAFVFFCSLQAYYKYIAWHQSRMVVYNTSGMQAIDFIDKTYYSFHGDSSLIAPGLKQNFHLKPTRIYYQSTNNSHNDLYLRSGNYLQFKDKKFFIASQGIYYPELEEPVAVDFAIIGNNKALKMAWLARSVKPGLVIFDGSCSPWKIEAWKKECDSLNLPYYSVQHEGAFVFNIP